MVGLYLLIADDDEQWAFLRRNSPYHNVKPRAEHGAYAPTLFYTSTRDDRVHPGHARKMVKRLRDEGHEETTFYYENMEGGHGGAADSSQAAFMWTLTYTFLGNQLGLGSSRK